MRTRPRNIYTAAFVGATLAAVDGQLPTEFRIWKAGLNTTLNGYDVLFDEQAAKQVMSAFLKHGVELMIDVDHLSLDDEHPNYDGAARGWFTIEVRRDAKGGPELWATNVRWNDDGRSELLSAKRRYFSPAFKKDSENRPLRLANLALVAMPATDGLEPLAAAHEDEEPMKLSLQKACESLRLAKRLSARKVAAKDIIRKLAEGDDMGGDGGGKVAGVEIPALAELLGVTIDPGQDPAAFVKELLGKLDEISAKLRGDAPAPEPAAETPPAEEMAATKEILRLTDSTKLVNSIASIATWRQAYMTLSEDRRQHEEERAKLDAAERTELVGKLVACGNESPATAYPNGKLAEHLATMPLATMRERVKVLALSAGARGPVAPDPKRRETADVHGLTEA